MNEDINSQHYSEKESDWKQFLRSRKKAPVNTFFILINVLMFLLTELTGSSLNAGHLVKWGAVYTPLISELHQYYRLFVCTFLHFGLAHLANNMLVLLVLGDNLEAAVGKIRYFIIYILGGTGASIISYLVEIRKGEMIVSAGASGAVFAVIGAMLYVVIRNRGRVGDYTTKQMVILAVVALYHGVTSAGVDNAAHLGGLICGFILGMILYHRRYKN